MPNHQQPSDKNLNSLDNGDKNILKKNIFKKDFRLIEYPEHEQNNAIVVNTIEKEEIFTLEEDIDEAN